jgi:hypothetical protein
MLFDLGNELSKCDICGAEVTVPFQCNYCGKYFCENHRLPENHNCLGSPARTPLGSYQSKVALADTAMKGKQSIQNFMPSTTYGNKFGHRFRVPPEVYLDEKYFEKLNEARTLEEVERIIQDYYKHHPKGT